MVDGALALLLGLTTPAAALGELGEPGPAVAFLLLGYLAEMVWVAALWCGPQIR